MASLHVFEQYWLYGEWVCGAWLCGVWLCGECGWWLCGEWPCGEWLCGVWLCAGGGGGGLPVVGHGVSVLHKISPQHLKDCPAHVMVVVDVPPPPGKWECMLPEHAPEMHVPTTQVVDGGGGEWPCGEWPWNKKSRRFS